MNEFVYYSELYHIYGFLLTDNQKEIFSLYYDENLSISEIAENKKVSRSYVGKIIEETRKKLRVAFVNVKNYKDIVFHQ